MAFADMTTSPRWFSTSNRVRTRPRSGLEADGRVSTIVARTDSVSPGRTGFVHRSSSTPGEARPADQPHHPAGRLPSARDQAAELGVPRRVAIRVERLGIVPAGELDDLVT